MKWYWVLLRGLVVGVAGTLVWASQRTAAAVVGWQDSLATTRAAVAQRDSAVARLTAALGGLAPAHDSAQHALDSLVTLGEAVTVAHGAARDAEGRAKAALTAAQSAHDSVTALQVVVGTADSAFAVAERLATIYQSQIAASGALLAVVRDSARTLAQQRDAERQNALDWQRRTEQADSLLTGTKVVRKWLGFIPTPHLHAGLGGTLGKVACTCGGGTTGWGLAVGLTFALTF